MGTFREVVESKIIDDVKVDLIEETMLVGDSDFVLYEVALVAYDHRAKEFNDVIDILSFSLENDAREYFNKVGSDWENGEVEVD